MKTNTKENDTDEKKQLIEAVNQNQVLQEMSNLRQDDYFRIQLLAHLANINESLALIANK